MSQHNGDSHAAYRFLAIFAHPDDEAFGCGGVMALNKQRGIHNTLICATKGEAGEISSPDLATPDNLGAVRELELLEAARHMGVDDLHFLGYRDSGMAGTAENQHPAAFANADAAAVVARLVGFIRATRPQVVVTFDPTGGYGHPDHIAIHKHTLAALPAAADPAYAPHLGPAWQVQRLYYPAFSREAFAQFADELIAQGMEPPNWGINEGEIPTQPAHAIVNVSTVAAAKWTAFKSHRTQFGEKHPFMLVSEAFMLNWVANEAFELAWPESKPDVPYTDLFEGLSPS